MKLLCMVAIFILIILFLLLGSFIVLIRPNKKRDTSYFEGKEYAHRGLHDDKVPENSLLAFRLARENGYGVELDVQMTKDEKLVVFHDGNLKRVCGVDGNLRDFTYDELQKFCLRGTNEKIPLFTDVLETLGEVDLICEIKSDNGLKNYKLCEMTYEELVKYKGRFVVESFSPFIVAWFKVNHPEVIRGQLAYDAMKDKSMTLGARFAMTHLLVNYVSRPDFVAYNHKDVRKLGYKLCKGIYRPFLVAWTAKGPYERKVAWGSFDSVIFERLSGNETC